MRTLKKTLCMVLVLSMMLGLCAIGTSAAPAETINYKEAVAVMKALNVMVGDANGFRPQAGLKRSEACRIVVALMGDDDIAVNTNSGFTDVPETEWYAKYVAYCASKGYVGGVGDGRFAPDSPLTGYAWALILLRVLGYDPSVEDIGGDDWTLDVATFLKRNTIEINTGIKGFGTGAINREEAAQCAFNALGMKTVRYTGGSTTMIGDIPVTTGKTRSDVLNAEGKNVKLMDTLGLTKKSTTDAAGRPATEYSVDEKAVLTLADVAAYTATTAVSDAALNKAMEDAKIDLVFGAGKVTNPTKNGVLVEIYKNKTIVTTDVTLDTVTDVKSYAATRNHGAYVQYSFETASAIKIYSTTIKADEKDNGVIEGTVAKGDAVLIADSTNGTAHALPVVRVAETVKGALTGVSSTGVVTLGGKTYTASETASADIDASALKVDGKDREFYVDDYGFLIAAVEANDTVDDVYAMVLTADYSVAISNGKLNTTYTVKAAGVDGKVTDYAVSEDTYNALTAENVTLPLVAKVTVAKGLASFTTVPSNMASEYTANSKDIATDIKAGTATAFIYADMAKDDDGKMKPTGTVTVMALGKNKGIAAGEGFYISANGKIADVVFGAGVALEETVSDEYVYVLGSYTTTTDGYVWNVIIKGEPTTITCAKAPAATGFYKSVDSEGNAVAAVAETDKVLQNVSGYVYMGATASATTYKDLTIDSKVPVYRIDVTEPEAAEVTSEMTWGDVKTIGDANDSIYLVKAADGKTVLAIYVLEVED